MVRFPVRRVLAVIAVGATLPFVSLFVARVLRLDYGSLRIFQAESLIQESLLGVVVAIGAAALCRSRRVRIGVTAVAVAAFGLAWTLRPIAHGSADADGPAMRVVAANVYFENSELDQLLSELAASEPDLVFLSEVQPAMVDAITRSDLGAELTHHDNDARPGTTGGYTLSRYPLADVRRIDVATRQFPAATFTVAGTTLDIINVHTSAPTTAIEPLVDELNELGQLTDRYAAAGDLVLLAGDFNASHEHGPFREFLTHGVVDAHLVDGQAWDLSWPIGRRILRPMVLLDRVVVSPEIGIESAGVTTVTGSDHRAVVVDVRLPAPE